MTRKMGNFVYRPKNSLNHEVIFPKSINPMVVDLKGLPIKSQRARRDARLRSPVSSSRTTSDIVRSKINQQIRGTLPDEYYAEEFSENARNDVLRPSRTKSHQVRGKHEELSKEALMAELSSLDDADLKIQNRLKQDRPAVFVAAQSRVASDNFSREEHIGSRVPKASMQFDLIPAFDLTFKDELLSSLIRRTMRRFVFFALFVIFLGVTIGLGSRFGASYFSESFHFKEVMLTKAQGGYVSMLKGREALLNFDAPEAEKHFLVAQQEFSDIERTLGFFFARSLLSFSAIPRSEYFEFSVTPS